MNKIAIAVCSREKNGSLPLEKVICCVCEEDCYYSGFGNESFEKFQNGEHVKLSEIGLEIKIVCRECSQNLFHMEFNVMIEIAKMENKNSFIEEVEKMVNAKRNNDF